MSEHLIVGIAGILLGFLIGWLIAWRMDEIFWTKQLAELRRREIVYRAQFADELAATRLQADLTAEAMRTSMEQRIAEAQARAEERISAAHARAEMTNALLRMELEARETAIRQEYERGLSEARAAYPFPSVSMASKTVH